MRTLSWRTTAVSLLLAQAAGADITFDPGVNYNTPTHPDGIAAGDFNRDGHTDLAVACESSDQISVLMNNGNGTFAVPMNIPTGSGTGPNFVRVADIDGDNDPDLIVSLGGTGQVLILLNNGAGNFVPGGTFAVGQNPRWIAATRLDANSTIDLIVVNRGSNTVSVLLNNGNMTFATTAYPVGTDPRGVTVADLFHNGRFQLLVTNHGDRTVSLLYNNGAGAFSAGPTINMPGQLRPEGIVAADLNRDGTPDIAVSGSDGPDNAVAVFLNVNNTLLTPIAYPVNGTNPGQIAAVDVDRDGDIDLVTVNQASDNITVLSNNGSGVFTATPVIAVGSGPQALTVGDFDHDSMTDLAVTNAVGNTTTVLLNAGAPPGTACFANCDNSTTPPVLNVNDFICFLNHFATNDTYANCDNSTTPPALNVLDFNCFLNRFAAGCS